MPCQERYDRKIMPLFLLIDALRRNSSTVVAAIGPLTNLALAELVAPGILRGVRVVLMGCFQCDLS